MTLAKFIEQHHITSTHEWADSNPNMPDPHMDHYKVTLKMAKRQMTIYFSKGLGHSGKPPQTKEVLSCLADDSASITEDFENWCANFGYGTDSRKAEKTYRACRKSAEKLLALLGKERYDQLLNETERE